MDPSGRAGAAEAVYEWSGSDKGGSDCGESRPGAVRAKDAAAMSGACPRAAAVRLERITAQVLTYEY